MFLKNAMNLDRTELLKTCINAMNTLSVISHEIVVWILFGFFVAQKLG